MILCDLALAPAPSVPSMLVDDDDADDKLPPPNDRLYKNLFEITVE